MDWIESGRPGPGFWSEFGRGLAGLHAFTGPDYGYPTENFIGRTPQRNTPHPAWPAFFRACRLEPLRALAEQAGLWQANWNAGYDGLSRRLDDLLPQTPPASLLHGDLWSGNYLVTAAGAPGLVDPAVYYGHGEADLAMTELFGGFESSFYAAYRETIPLESGYPERRDIYNLYHLLNHLILFGGSYAVAVARIVTRYK
jgi:fructosamine-3-kinase